ncbi:hypothetical protein BDZ89DRAFT_1065274 [Hymenopellis radicata]|nr:hypothetical protein BDZ89DRAFT_1065274 [Hymenopellis radicata]
MYLQVRYYTHHRTHPKSRLPVCGGGVAPLDDLGVIVVVVGVDVVDLALLSSSWLMTPLSCSGRRGAVVDVVGRPSWWFCHLVPRGERGCGRVGLVIAGVVTAFSSLPLL